MGLDLRTGLHEAPPDPPDRGAVLPLVWPRPGSTYRYTCLSECVTAYATHWLGCTRPCTGWENRCEGCLRYQAPRWTGFLCGWEPAAQRQVVVAISACAARGAGLRRARLRGISLRGVGLSLRRKGPSRNSEVELRLLDLGPVGPDLPQALPILPTLLAVWGLQDCSPPVIQLFAPGGEDGAGSQGNGPTVLPV